MKVNWKGLGGAVCLSSVSHIFLMIESESICLDEISNNQLLNFLLTKHKYPLRNIYGMEWIENGLTWKIQNFV